MYFKEEAMEYYFSYEILVFIAIGMILIQILSLLPALFYYKKYKYNILLDENFNE